MHHLDDIFQPDFLAKVRRSGDLLRTDRYPLCPSTIDEAELRAIAELFVTGRFTMGEQVRKFEDAFAARVGAKAAIMVNSGSSANLATTAAMRYGKHSPLRTGDEVLVSALSWPTTVWPLAQLGLKPVFVDANPSDLSVCLDSCAAMLGPRTRALMLVHVLGTPANMDEVLQFCQAHGLRLVEDCCESLGAAWNDVHVGRFGGFGTFSFFFSHHLNTIEGGMVITDDPAEADALRSLRSHGWTRDRSDQARWRDAYPEIDERYLFVLPGFNLRPTEFQAAIGLVQLAKLDAMLQGRAETAALIHQIVKEARAACSPIGTPQRGGTRSWMTLPFVVDEGVERRQFCQILEEQGIETRPIIAGNLTLHPATQLIEAASAPDLTVATDVWSRGFMIGCHARLLSKQVTTLRRAFHAVPSR